MRVLLPLRKAPSNTHASNSSHSDDHSSSSEGCLEDLEQGAEEEDEDEGVLFEIEVPGEEGDEVESFSLSEDLDTDERDTEGASSAAWAPSLSLSKLAATPGLVSSVASSEPLAASVPSSPDSDHRQQQHQPQPQLGQLPLEASSLHAGLSSIGSEAIVPSFPPEISTKPAAATGTPKSPKDPPLRTFSFKTKTPAVSPSSRKRRALDSNTACDSKPASRKRRPSLDQKLPPRDLRFEATHTNNNTMVGGGRRVASCWRYNDEDCRDSPVSAVDEGGCYHHQRQQQQPRQHHGHHRNPAEEEEDCPLENNPASARRDLPIIYKEDRTTSDTTNKISNNDLDLLFALDLKKRGLEIREQDGDGNCLFRAISLQVYGDSANHEVIRKQCLDFMVRSKGHYCGHCVVTVAGCLPHHRCLTGICICHVLNRRKTKNTFPNS
jgi:hypothetical protein